MSNELTLTEENKKVTPKNMTRKRPSRAIVKAPLNDVIQQDEPSPREMFRKKLAMQKARDSEIVRGKFINHEQSGAPLDFWYKAYPGDKLQRWHFKDGEIKEIPLGVAMHINNNCSTPVYEHLKGDKKMIAGNNDEGENLTVTGYKNRFSFQPLNFTSVDFAGGSHNNVYPKVLKVERDI